MMRKINFHNWIIKNINRKFLRQYSIYIKGTLLDLGCGEMPHENFLNHYVDKYIGIDWGLSFHSIKAKILCDVNYSLALCNNIADTVISFSVLEHLYDPQKFLYEAYRILKPEGYLIIQVPWQWWVHEAPFDYFRYSPFGLKYLVEKANFELIIIEPSSGFFTMLFLKIIYFTNRVKGPLIFRWFIRILLIPLWTILQLLAPLLDKLDNNWELETSSYWVVAKKNGD